MVTYTDGANIIDVLYFEETKQNTAHHRYLHHQIMATCINGANISDVLFLFGLQNIAHS